MTTTLWDAHGIRASLMLPRSENLSQQQKRELGQVLTEEQVLSFERQYQVTLPESYRTFVTQVGDGGAGPHHGLWSLNRSYTATDEEWRPQFLATPFPHTKQVGPDDLGENYDEDQLTVGSMIIADMGCGSFSRLIVTGDAQGQVWSDHLGVDSTLLPGPDFRDWYLAWVDSPH